MKRYGHLYDQITSFENLLQAAHQSQQGKRFKASTLHFNHHLEAQLIQLQTELTTQTYQPGPYRTFEIYEPKPRVISAAPYRDRVVHHAICQIISPLLERSFIPDSYANRKHHGTHRALKRFTHFANSHRYILQCDIRRYFPSIDHALLKLIIRQQIKCPRTLALIDIIIDSSTSEPDPAPNSLPIYFPGDNLLSPLRPKGLPIGNLTSQFLANLYLSRFDHFVYETLKPCKYIRYVDDFALFSDDHHHLTQARQAIEAYLTLLRLQIHPIKSQLFETQQGANFLGFRIFPAHGSSTDRPYLRLQNSYLQRSRTKFKQLKYQHKTQQKTLQNIQQSLTSWTAHLNQGNTWRIRHKLLATLPQQWLHLQPEQAI
jgi:RNA-directed DNA polymerase